LPLSRELWGALMFIDVKGFTKITEYANSKGHYGIEIITEVLNDYFDKLARLIYANGGYIAKFGGDSCLSVFPGLCQKEIISQLCAEIDKLCAELDNQYLERYGFGFAVHGGVSFCRFTLNIVGDLHYHADYFFSSPALAELYHQVETASGAGIQPPVFHWPDQPQTKAFTEGKLAEPGIFLPAAVARKLEREEYPAELRNAAVLFINLLPSEGTMIPLDDYQHFFIRAQRWVSEFGGVINKIDFTDKGYLLIVLFGVPEVHSDDVERAFLCALRIVQIPFDRVKCRIGVTSSNIYCGVIGSSMRYEYGIIGNAVNIAARLMSRAEPGQIALSEEIIPAICSRFETRYVESAVVKGIKDPIQIYLLENELPEHWAFFNDKFKDLPLLLAQGDQDAMFAFMRQSEPGALMITGGKGTGKSFIIWLLSTAAKNKNLNVEISLLDRGGQNFRLEFFFNLLRRKMGIRSFRQEFFRLSDRAGQYQLDWNEDLVRRYLLPERNEGLSISGEDRELARTCLAGMCEHLLSGCDLLMVDNYDLYDRDSQDLLQELISRFLAGGRKVALSGNPGLTVSFPSGFTHIALQLENYTVSQGVQYINHQLPLTTEAARTWLFRISEGNPQFLNGLVQQVKVNYDYRQDLVSENTIENLQARGLVSASLENMLMASFEGMPSEVKDILKYAAIYGRQFSVSELRNVFGIKSVHHLESTISELVKDLCLELSMRGGEPVYGFSNPLLRESIYRSVLFSEKKEAHLQIASSLASKQDFDDEDLQSIVFHYLQAGDRDGIVKWSALAASRFYDAGAWDFCRYYYDLLASWTLDPEIALDAQLKLAEIALMQADNPLARELLDKLPPLKGRQQEMAIYLNTVYLNNTAEYVKLQQYLANKLNKLHDSQIKPLVNVFHLESLLFTNDIKHFFHSALGLFPKLISEPRVQNRLAGVIAQAYINCGEYDKALRYYEHKLGLAEQLHDGLGIRIALNGMGVSCFRMGKKDEARQHYQKALQIAEQYGDRNGYSKVLLNLGAFYWGEMRYDEAYESYQKALILAKKMGNSQQESILVYDMGQLLYYQNKHEQALELINQSLEISRRINDFAGISFCHDAMGDIYFGRGDLALAEATYRENLTLQLTLQDREGIAHTWGNLGNCEKAKKNYLEARKYYYKQFALLSRVQDWDGAGRARFNLAMVDREQHLLRRALHQLDKAFECFTKCQAKYFLQICEEQRQEISNLLEQKHPSVNK